MGSNPGQSSCRHAWPTWHACIMTQPHLLHVGLRSRSCAVGQSLWPPLLLPHPARLEPAGRLSACQLGLPLMRRGCQQHLVGWPVQHGLRMGWHPGDARPHVSLAGWMLL